MAIMAMIKRLRKGGGGSTNEFAPFHEPAKVWIHDGHDWMYVVDYTDGGAPIGAYVDGFYRDSGEPALAGDDFANAEAYGRYRAELAMLQQRLHEARRRAETAESVLADPDLATRAARVVGHGRWRG